MADIWPDGAARPQKHSLMIDGHRTSISLEPLFWQELQLMAQARGESLAQLVTRVDRARLDDSQPGNLSSSLRIYVLLHKGDNF